MGPIGTLVTINYDAGSWKAVSYRFVPRSRRDYRFPGPPRKSSMARVAMFSMALPRSGPTPDSFSPMSFERVPSMPSMWLIENGSGWQF